MNNIPKNYLVRLIIENADDNKIRKYFSIKEDTDLFSRLSSYSIAKLDEFIYRQDSKFIKLFEKYSEEFPLRSAPTLYILNKTKTIPPNAIEEKSVFLASKGRCEALIFPDTRVIRAIYTRQPIQYLKKQNVYELVLGYEKRLELVECDPESPNYSEIRVEYSLENALVWYPKNCSSYAVIACCDFSAVSSLITYLNIKYGIGASLPDLTETMLNNLASGSKIRNATFTLEFSEENESNIDVNSITVYDKKLAESKIYTQMIEQKGRVQRSGFFVDHPYLLRAGLGISCKYGRIWTPAHLDRNELISIAVGSINKLDAELKRAAENDLNDYFIYYSNKEVFIGSVKITGSTRKLFDRLIYYLALSQKNNNIEIEIDLDFQKQLAAYYKKLKLESYIVGYCTNCSSTYLECPKCGQALNFLNQNEFPILICNSCGNKIEESNILCDCGESIPIIDGYSTIEYLPTPELMDAIGKYSDSLHPQICFPTLFKIEGNKLLSLHKKKNLNARIVNLSDLKFWRVRAHYNSIATITPSAKRYVINAHEKCNINNYHPKEEDCRQCAKKKINKQDFESNTICLLRTFGIPINVVFDGIHHGHEFADIVYTDEFNDKQHKIAIHVKRHAKYTPARGLGRSNEKIKGLYAQVFYTLFELEKKKKSVDTIGIAIPNRISADVLDSIQTIVLRMGYSFIALQKSDWEKIAQAAIETVQF
jgi:hypothetical protein